MKSQSFLAPRTCFDLYQLGIRTSGNYFIDPDGPYAGDYPVSVYCDLNSGSLYSLLIVLLTSRKVQDLKFQVPQKSTMIKLVKLVLTNVVNKDVLFIELLMKFQKVKLQL